LIINSYNNVNHSNDQTSISMQKKSGLLDKH
jgi:hypothetical protein